MKKTFFITGTDTDIGKTHTTLALLNYFNHYKVKTAALKPIASGAQYTAAGLRNSDALQLQAAMSMDIPYEQVNPLTFEPAIAPHLAAVPNSLDIDSTIQACQPMLQSNYDILFIEGVGGWTVPLNHKESMADLARALGFPIILVSGMRLGCLNHTILTWHHIKTCGLPFAGWIANHIDPNMKKLSENINTLTTLLESPPLGIIEYGSCDITPIVNINNQLTGQ